MPSEGIRPIALFSIRLLLAGASIGYVLPVPGTGYWRQSLESNLHRIQCPRTSRPARPWARFGCTPIPRKQDAGLHLGLQPIPSRAQVFLFHFTWIFLSQTRVFGGISPSLAKQRCVSFKQRPDGELCAGMAHTGAVCRHGVFV